MVPGAAPTPSLRYWRIQRALFQEQLAKAAGIGVMTVIRGEAGRQLRLDVIGKLAKALDVDPAELQRRPPSQWVPAASVEEQLVPVPGLIAVRLRAQRTQRWLAERSGVDHTTIARLEAGDLASADVIRRLAQALDVTPGDLQRQPPA